MSRRRATPTAPAWAQRPSGTLRRRVVPVPAETEETDALFLVLRRMRVPLVFLISIFTIAVAGLSAMPGLDGEGNPRHMTIFESFYVMSYTATTIGYGEVPYAFTTAQRMWVTAMIYLTVIGWAWAIGALLTLLQDRGFQQALATQSFRRKVRRLREPFLIVAGYGPSGQAVAHALDSFGRRFVVIDDNRSRIELVDTDGFEHEVPAIDGDVREPGVLGLAGLDHPFCEGVLALADDEANLSVAMTADLLRPEVAVIAHIDSPAAETSIDDFTPEAVVNPYDRYGDYLTTRLRKPDAYRLVMWLMSPYGTPLEEPLAPVPDGLWVVVADDQFGDEIMADLERAGLRAERREPRAGDPDVEGAVGLIAGTTNDVLNIAMAAHARVHHDGMFVAIRQGRLSNAHPLEAFDPESVFTPSKLVAIEVVSRIVTPGFWAFLQHLIDEPDDACRHLLTEITERVGTESPEPMAVAVTDRRAPALARWLRRESAGEHGTMTVDELLRDPADRRRHLAVYPVALRRGGELLHQPAPDTALATGDELIVVGRNPALDRLMSAVHDENAVEYLATGHDVPTSIIGRLASRQRRRLARG